MVMAIHTLVLDGPSIDIQLNKSGGTRYELAGWAPHHQHRVIIKYDVNIR